VPAEPNTDLDELLAVLDLTIIDEDVFAGSHPSKTPCAPSAVS